MNGPDHGAGSASIFFDVVGSINVISWHVVLGRLKKDLISLLWNRPQNFDNLWSRFINSFELLPQTGETRHLTFSVKHELMSLCDLKACITDSFT